MTNEEILEEMYTVVHQNKVLEMFTEKVNLAMKFGDKKPMYEIVSQIYYEFLKQGLIKE